MQTWARSAGFRVKVNQWNLRKHLSNHEILGWVEILGWNSVIFIEIRINSLPNIQPKRILASFCPEQIPGPVWTKENGGKILCVYVFLDNTWQECFTDPTAQATWQPVVSWLIFCDNPLIAFHFNGRNTKGFENFAPRISTVCCNGSAESKARFPKAPQPISVHDGIHYSHLTWWSTGFLEKHTHTHHSSGANEHLEFIHRIRMTITLRSCFLK